MRKLLYFSIILFFISFSTGIAQNKIPRLNAGIVKYVSSVIGTTVGRGECWDLADQALIKNNARFDKSSQKTLYIFGKEYDPQNENVYPGDIIQFKNVVVSYKKGNMMFTENFPHHTAIVYEVVNDHQFKLAHQNTGLFGRKVGISELDLENVKKGKLRFYRPVPE